MLIWSAAAMFFARAIVQDAPLLLLDEPFSAIDQTTEAGLTEIIREWRTEGRTVIIVIHDLSTAMAVSDSCLLLGGGRACFGKTTDILTTDNLLAYHYLSETQAEFLSLLQNSGVAMFEWLAFDFMQRALVSTSVLSGVGCTCRRISGAAPSVPCW